MARTNKYSSLNFNDIYEKKITTTATNKHHRSSSSSSISSATSPTSKTILSNSRIHGNMLVLTRPSPKPIVPSSKPSPPSAIDQPTFESDSISLRPLGRTGSAPPLPCSTFPVQGKDFPVSPKTNKFVPPHLRPGFHGRGEKPEPEIQKQTGFAVRSNIRQSPLRSPVYHDEEGRPKSGGGYERGRGGHGVNPLAMNRPRSSGSPRPYSSG